jgi:hypothetical protein
MLLTSCRAYLLEKVCSHLPDARLRHNTREGAENGTEAASSQVLLSSLPPCVVGCTLTTQEDDFLARTSQGLTKKLRRSQYRSHEQS